jgi:hypothetical protein
MRYKMGKKVEKKVVEKVNQDEMIEEIVNETVEEVKSETVKKKKTYRELRSELRSKRNDIEVEVLNLNSSTTVFRDRDKKVILKLDNAGDREFVTLADIYDIANRNKGAFKKHFICISDVDSDEYSIEDILTYLNLDEIYQDDDIVDYDCDYIGTILKLDANKFERFTENASMELVRRVAERAIDLYKKKKFDSRIKENALISRLGREDLFEN